MAEAFVEKPETRGGQIWLVTYECRTEAVRIAQGNDGFFAPGQKPLWRFSAIDGWDRCVYEGEGAILARGARDGAPKTLPVKRAAAWWTRRGF